MVLQLRFGTIYMFQVDRLGMVLCCLSMTMLLLYSRPAGAQVCACFCCSCFMFVQDQDRFGAADATSKLTTISCNQDHFDAVASPS